MMSPIRNLMMLSALPAIFLISCALSTMAKNDEVKPSSLITEQLQVAPPVVARDIASKKLAYLTYRQIKAMPAKKVYAYYKKLYVFMAEQERFQYLNINGLPVKGSKKSAKFNLFMQEAFAGSETLPPYKNGNECLIGGYWEIWGINKKTGRLSCGAAAAEAKDPRTTCFIGNVQGHKCNPKFFGYHNETTGEEFCAATTKDLTTASCSSTVEKYKKDYGEEVWQEHFKNGLLRATGEQDFDKAVEQVMSDYERIKTYCGGSDDAAEWGKIHNAGQNYSCFNLQIQYNDLKQAVKEITQEEPSPAPEAPAEVTGDGSGLGPYACIQTALKQLNYPNVSSKYIAALAIGSKFITDNQQYRIQYTGRTEVGYSPDTAANTARTLKSTIRSLHTVGLCNKGANNYEFSGGQAGQSEAWLTQKYLNDKTGLNANEYKSVFELDWNKIFPRKSLWDMQTETKQQEVWRYHTAGSTVNKCVAKTGTKITKKQCEAVFKTCNLTPECNFKQDPPENNSHSSPNPSPNPDPGPNPTPGVPPPTGEPPPPPTGVTPPTGEPPPPDNIETDVDTAPAGDPGADAGGSPGNF